MIHFPFSKQIFQFKLESVHKAGAVVDLAKLKWYNQKHLEGVLANGTISK